mmetsp:Transcript_138189/g.240311  ORF Transcript_138189/g.240311 Transcript_138189/m.240311 type:complete len:142 (-) Transcript_138189:428-853(-)
MDDGVLLYFTAPPAVLITVAQFPITYDLCVSSWVPAMRYFSCQSSCLLGVAHEILLHAMVFGNYRESLAVAVIRWMTPAWFSTPLASLESRTARKLNQRVWASSLFPSFRPATNFLSQSCAITSTLALMATPTLSPTQDTR